MLKLLYDLEYTGIARQVLLLDHCYLSLPFSKNVYTCLGEFKLTELKVLFAGQSPGSDSNKFM